MKPKLIVPCLIFVFALVLLVLYLARPASHEGRHFSGTSGEIGNDLSRVSDEGGLTFSSEDVRETKSEPTSSSQNNRELDGQGPEMAAAQPTGVTKPSQRARQIRRLMKNAGGRSLSREEIMPVIASSKDPSMSLRATAVTALGASQSPEAIIPLIESLMDTNLNVRSRAKSALRNLIGVEIKYDPSGSKSKREKSVRQLLEMAPSFSQSLVLENSHRH